MGLEISDSRQSYTDATKTVPNIDSLKKQKQVVFSVPGKMLESVPDFDGAEETSGCSIYRKRVATL